MKWPTPFAAAVACLVALAATAFLGKSYETGLRGIDSNIHAMVSMSVTSGPGLAPRLPIPIKNFSASAPAAPGTGIDADRVFNDHPFFVFWVNGLIMRALGPSGWSARLLTGMLSVGSVLLVLALGTLWVSRAFGVLAALFLIFCRDFILTSATVSLDTALVFFILLTFYHWTRARANVALRPWVALGAAAGIGLWVKTPLVLLVFPVALVFELIELAWPSSPKALTSREAFRTRILPLVAAGFVAVTMGSLVWVYTGLAGGWNLVQDYWVRQLWGTAVGGREQAQGWDWGRAFFYNLRTGFLPGLPFLVVALARIARKRHWGKVAVRVPMIAVAVVGLAVTSLRFKMGHYFTPIFPFLALLSAYSLSDWVSARVEREQRFYSGLAMFTPLLLALLLVSPISFGPDAFVALRRFVPYIQTHGHCEDVIALVAGGEPVGSDLDYKLFLGFYTGRTVQSVSCEEISRRIDVEMGRPAWVILDDEHLKTCITPQALSRYPTRLLVGTQYLLSSRIQAGPVLDLTPLELDRGAVRDCAAPPYPRDLWHRYLDGGQKEAH